MRTVLLCALACVGLLSACSPDDKEVDASQNAQCLNWGARLGSSEYIQCRATLAVNYRREKDNDSNSAMAGLAIGMAAGASGGRK